MHKDKKPLSINITIDMPTAEQGKSLKKPSLIEKVQEAITMIDSGHDSRAEWDMIQCLNKCLMKKDKLTKNQAALLKMIQPVLKRYKGITSEKIEQDTDKLQKSKSLFTNF